MPVRRPHRRRASRRSHLHTLVSILPTAVSAVSLSDFSPYASNLTPSCSSVYTETIPGCTISDFTGGGSCSSSCLDGLVQISMQVYESCTATQDYQLLVAQFLNGNGIEVLCPGVVVVTAKLPTKTPSPTSVTKHSPTSTPKQKPTRTPVPPESGTSTISREPFPTTSLIQDTRPPPCVSSTCTDKSTRRTDTDHHTTTSTSHTRKTSSTSRTRSRSTPAQQTQSKTHSPSASSSSSSSTSSSSIVHAASASQRCIDFGGDPFSNCPSSNSHNAAPPALRVSGSWTRRISLFCVTLCMSVLLVA